MKRKTITSIQKQKNKKKLTCLTAYTTSISKIIDQHVDIILIGDSVGTVIYGMQNTQGVTLEMMKNHGKTVTNSTKKAFTIIDMPYHSFKNKKQALVNAKELIKYTKCQAVKIEADKNTIKIIKYLIAHKVNVVSHIGVTPQKFKDFKKIRYVGNSLQEKEDLTNLAIELEKVGSIMIFLECIKENVAKIITHKLKIPTIGIGASIFCDGQVLVINDILMMENEKKMPRFIKTYSNIHKEIEKSVKKFTKDVINKKFPKKINTY